MSMSTDVEWEKWGRQDPYYGVITWDKFRADKLDDAALADFFDSGERHVGNVLASCRRYIDPQFAPTRVLDFGCGVGRVTRYWSGYAGLEIHGCDYSPVGLDWARANLPFGHFTINPLAGPRLSGWHVRVDLRPVGRHASARGHAVLVGR